MASNAGWNWLFFRQRNLRLAYLFFFPYSLLAIAVVAALLQVDRLSGMVFAIYLIYLPYALAWSFQVWRLNASVPKLGGYVPRSPEWSKTKKHRPDPEAHSEHCPYREFHRSGEGKKRKGQARGNEICGRLGFCVRIARSTN